MRCCCCSLIIFTAHYPGDLRASQHSHKTTRYGDPLTEWVRNLLNAVLIHRVPCGAEERWHTTSASLSWSGCEKRNKQIVMLLIKASLFIVGNFIIYSPLWRRRVVHRKYQRVKLANCEWNATSLKGWIRLTVGDELKRKTGGITETVWQSPPPLRAVHGNLFFFSSISFYPSGHLVIIFIEKVMLINGNWNRPSERLKRRWDKEEAVEEEVSMVLLLMKMMPDDTLVTNQPTHDYGSSCNGVVI